LGGLVATHLARVKALDYLCADRTFSELANIAELTYGRIAGALYRLITWWTDDISVDYLEANCYKVIAFDSNDEVINPLGSLKHGVMSKLIERKLVTTPEPAKPVLKDYYSFFSPLRLIASAHSFSYFIKKTIHSYNVDQRLNNHHPLLSKQEGIALFCACRRVSELILNVMQEVFAALPREPKLSSSSSGSDKSRRRNSQEPNQAASQSDISLDVDPSGKNDNNNESFSPTKLLNKQSDKDISIDSGNINLHQITSKKSYSHLLENHSYGTRYIQELIPEVQQKFN